MPRLKLTERQQLTVLVALRLVGYLNLLVLIGVLLSLKGPQAPCLLVVAVPAITVSGAVFYYLGWQRSLFSISKTEGRRYMWPYLLGFYLLVAVIALFVILALFAGR